MANDYDCIVCIDIHWSVRRSDKIISVIATRYSDDIVYYVRLGETGLDVIDNIYDIVWANSATIKDKMLTKLDYSTIMRAFKTIEKKTNK